MEAAPSIATPAPARSLPESSATLIAEAAALADQGRHEDATRRCERVLERFGPSAPAYFLLGLLHQAAGHTGEAEACFRKAVYLDPGHDEALLALAFIAQRRGENESAAAYRRRAGRARAKKGTS
jgi:chemotaxis protein methyltransferase WspC